MSNQAVLIATKFEDHNGVTHGFRMYDDYAQTYCNCMEQSDLNKTPLEFLELATTLYANDTVVGIVDSLIDSSKGIEINGEWFGWEKIKYIWDEGNEL